MRPKGKILRNSYFLVQILSLLSSSSFHFRLNLTRSILTMMLTWATWSVDVTLTSPLWTCLGLMLDLMGCTTVMETLSMTNGEDTSGFDWSSLLFFRCPEYDLQESNKYVFVATLHNCDWGGDWFTSCDRGGCQANSFKKDPNMFCPEERLP